MKHFLWIFLALTLNSYGQTPGGGVTDIDGNQYNSVIIGTQEWQKENLNVSKYADGTVIPEVTDPTTWANLTTGAWCYYNNDPVNGAIYGKLYNWYAVMGIYNSTSLTTPTLRKQFAPTGWHIPTEAEWTTLIDYLGGEAVAGSKMKETGTSHWYDDFGNNLYATNVSGFSALPGGYFIGDSGFFTFLYLRNATAFWSSSEAGNIQQILVEDGVISGGSVNMHFGLSLRCLKNSALNNQSFNTNSFNIYPNPAVDQITIDLGTNSNSIGWSYKIVNTLGQEVLNGVLNSQQNIIELNNIKGQGVYFVKIYDSSNSLLGTKKIIIQQ